MGNLFSFPWTRREDLFEGLPPDTQGVVWGYAEANFRAENSWADINRMEVVAELTAIQAILDEADYHENDIVGTTLYHTMQWVLSKFERLLDETDAHIVTRKEVLKARFFRMLLERNYNPEHTRASRLEEEDRHHDTWGLFDVD